MTSSKWLFRLQYLFLPLLLVFGLSAHAQAPLNAQMEQQGRVFAAQEKSKKTVKKAKKKAEKKPVKKKAAAKTTKKHKKTDAGHHKKKGKKAHSTSHAKKKEHTNVHTTKKATHKKPHVDHHGSDDSFIGEYNGRRVYEGPRGGQYYINDQGNKTYLKPEQKLHDGKHVPEMGN